MKYILLIFIVYALLLWSFDLEITCGKRITSINYNGLVWVTLDKWTIYKYKSTDLPMKWINISKYTSN